MPSTTDSGLLVIVTTRVVMKSKSWLSHRLTKRQCIVGLVFIVGALIGIAALSIWLGGRL